MKLLIQTRTLAVALAAGTTSLCAPIALAQNGGQDGGADLPVRKLTLYRSGVGFFERSGTVTDNDELTLSLDADYVNDILKSMIVLDYGGRVEGVSYGSREPLERRLAGFDINLAGSPTMANILAQLRGAQVRLLVAGESNPVTGRVVSVERRTESLGDNRTQSVPYINLSTPMLRSIRLDTVSTFEILDADLRRELELALEALTEQRDDDEKSVSMRFAGAGERRVTVAYVHETPVWKASYRLVLPTDDGATSSDVQGWAIVENTTDDDWEDVTLGLVSGQPVSFVMDLYQPLFLDRPEVPVPAIAALAPEVYERGLGRSEAEAVREQQLEMNVARIGGGGGGQSPFQQQQRQRPEQDSSLYSLSVDDISDYAAKAAATAGESGEVFKYELAEPVTIERRQSAMLPILRGEAETRRVSIFTPGSSTGEHPMRGVELTNSTGLELMPGPISVFDGVSYAGDAQIGFVADGEARLLAYAVDLETSIRQQVGSARRVTRLTIVDGVIRQRVEYDRTTTYDIANADQSRGRTVLIEHPLQAGWEAEFTNATQLEETNGSRRLEAQVDAGADLRVTVKESRTSTESAAVLGFDLELLLRYERDGRVSKRVAEAIRRAAELRSAEQLIRDRVAGLEQTRRELSNEQARVRENLKSVPENSDLQRRYLRSLGSLEDDLERTRRELDAARTDLARAQRELRAYVQSLDLN
ncbi:MAG: hypothetical protein AAGI17_04380 [Planctomycetota bacterium]